METNKKLKFLIEGKLYPLPGEEIHLGSLIQFLYRCPYRYALHRLEAGKDSVYGTIPIWTPNEGREGAKRHKELQDLLVLTKGVDGEVSIAYLYKYKGKEYLLKGWLDYLVNLDTFEFEEFHTKTSSRPALTPHELSYPNAYAYILCKLHNLPKVKYTYKVWGKNTSLSNTPDISIPKLYTPKDFPTTEKELNKLVDYHTGQVECKKTYGGCDFCKVRRKCNEKKVF